MSNRVRRGHVVKEISETGGISTTDGIYFSVSKDVADKLSVGDAFELETKNLSLITGLKFNGEWLFRKTDEDLDREHQEFCEKLDKQHEKLLEAKREDWKRRTEALPEWLQGRFRTFFERGGRNFEKEGWGYELVVAELAVLYNESGLEDTDEINQYADREGTSGNQHAFAKALVRGLQEDVDLTGTVSALSVITSDAFYEGKK